MAPMARLVTAVLVAFGGLAAAQLPNPTTVSPTVIVYTIGSGTLATFTPTYPAVTSPAAPSSGTQVDASSYLGSIAQAGSSASAALSASGQKISGPSNAGMARSALDSRTLAGLGAVAVGAVVGAGMVMA